MSAQLPGRDTGLDTVTTREVLPERRHRWLGGKTVGSLLVADDRAWCLGREREGLDQVRRAATGKHNAVAAVNEVTIGNLDVQISCLVMHCDDVLDQPVGAAHRPQYSVIEAPVVEIAVDLRARGKFVNIELVVDRERRVAQRKLLTVLRE